MVQARFCAEPEDVLGRRDRQLRARAPRELEQLPMRLPSRDPHACTVAPVQRAPPAECRVVVVRPRVRDGPRRVPLGPMRVPWVPVERELQDAHTREAELLAEALDWFRDHAEILGHERQPSELAAEGPKDRLAGTSPPAPRPRGARARWDRPVRDEAAEVIDAQKIEERELPAEAVDPPAVTTRPKRGPVVERAAPALAARAERIRRYPGDDPRSEEH